MDIDLPKLGRHRGQRFAGAATVTAAIFLSLFAPAAGAIVTPGVPVAVAPGVPDQGRTWELVTSPDPVAAQLYNVRGLSLAGDRVVYVTKGPLPGAASGMPEKSANVAVRGAGGWDNAPVAVPFPDQGEFPTTNGPFYLGPQAFDPGLTSWLGLRHLPLPPGATENDVGLFRWAPGGPTSLLADLGPSGQFVGASADGQRLLLTSESHLLPADATRTEGRSVYELDGSTLRLVDVDSGGALISDCGSNVATDAATEEGWTIPFADVFSRDGRRVFFSSKPGCVGTERVFMRGDGTTTTEISASQCTLADCGPAADVAFVGATPGGSSAFLVSAERLTYDDANSHSDLYRYDADSGELILLTPAGADVAPTTKYVHTSQDGSRVYFDARAWNGTETVGRPNVYLADGGEVKSVPGLKEIDGLDRKNRYIELSSNGRYAVFTTSEQILPGDTDQARDVYRYDAVDGSLTQISAGPAGGNGNFDAVVNANYFSQSAVSHSYRFVSSDGGRIFFSTAERLLPEDRNEVEDVYEWTSAGLGLVSSGAGDHPSMYLGATADGGTVLFRTSQTLLPRDRDGGQLDFYVARIGGGFAEPSVAGECEACRRAPGQPAGRATPATAVPAAGIDLGRIDAKARRRIAATGWISLLVEAPTAGRLSASARAPLGGRQRTVAATVVSVPAPGPVQVRMRLSKRARAVLADGGSLRIKLALSLEKLRRETHFVLRGQR